MARDATAAVLEAYSLSDAIDGVGDAPALIAHPA
jgi:hypothetical protein